MQDPDFLKASPNSWGMSYSLLSRPPFFSYETDLTETADLLHLSFETASPIDMRSTTHLRDSVKAPSYKRRGRPTIDRSMEEPGSPLSKLYAVSFLPIPVDFLYSFALIFYLTLSRKATPATAERWGARSSRETSQDNRKTSEPCWPSENLAELRF